MSNHPKEEKTLVLIKPDGIQRALLGEILHRFERKGLKIIGLKMLRLDDVLTKAHYGKYEDKPFFAGLKDFMQSSPIVAVVLCGVNAVKVTRLIVGQTKSYEAIPGTIRGDFAMSMQSNLVHASDPEENPAEEVKRFFEDDELFSYKKINFDLLHAPDELK
ncbi:MAG: nucleoside-diphosphate kinase [bacterium]|nr:nucleoside-diphosphate kinase [bacterium]